MALRATPNAIVMGSTTAGADGNISAIPLPGNPNSLISGRGFLPGQKAHATHRHRSGMLMRAQPSPEFAPAATRCWIQRSQHSRTAYMPGSSRPTMFASAGLKNHCNRREVRMTPSLNPSPGPRVINAAWVRRRPSCCWVSSNVYNI